MQDHTTDAANTLETPARPRHLAELFWVFTRMALQGFGGVLPIAQRELVERTGWVTRAQFLELLALSQVLPGPNVVNLSLMLGDRWFGWRGALAACAGMLLLPLVLVLLLALAADQSQQWPAVAGALRGMALAAGGLVVATAVKLAVPLLRRGAGSSPLGIPPVLALAGAALVAVAVLRWHLAAVVLLLGCAGITLAWWRLRAKAGPTQP